jgi:hypothetical protein
MRTRAQATADRHELWRQINREHRREAKAKIVSLRGELRAARQRRKLALREAKERCRAERIAARERARAMRLRVLEELREAMRAERAAARQACTLRLGEARGIKDDVARARAELLAEKKYQADLRRIERANRQRRKEAPRAARIERQAESDDEVRANISAELLSLFERVKRSIKASPRMSRTERMLKYAEEHPDEVLLAIEDKTDALVRELEQREREARKSLHRGPPRPRYTPEQLAEVPF